MVCRHFHFLSIFHGKFLAVTVRISQKMFRADVRAEGLDKYMKYIVIHLHTQRQMTMVTLLPNINP